MPVNYIYYHPKWRDVVRPEALKRAGYRCEICKAPNKKLITRDRNGQWMTVSEDEIQRGFYQRKDLTKIQLTISHTNHLTIDNRPENLRALCQKCHLKHDQPHKMKMRQVHPQMSVDKLLSELAAPGGELVLNIAFAKLRGLSREKATLEMIGAKRQGDLYQSQYDKAIRDKIIILNDEISRLKIHIANILAHAFQIKDPNEYFSVFLSPDDYFALTTKEISRTTGQQD